VARVPFQPPLASHEVTLVEFQFKVALLPAASSVWFALNVTVGGGCATLIVTRLVALPPAPEQVRVKLAEALSGPTG